MIKVSYDILIYKDKSGKEPVMMWLKKITKIDRFRILKRLDSVRAGNLGDYKKIKNVKNLYEFRFHFGPGYRIYFSMEGKNILLLLSAGNKSSQVKDIKKAKLYLEEFMIDT